MSGSSPSRRAVLAPPPEPPVDVVHDYPDVVSAEEPPALEPPPLAPDDPTEESWQEPMFDADRPPAQYVLPDRKVLKPSPAVTGDTTKSNARTAEVLVNALANFGVEATIVGQIAGPRVTRYELQLAPGRRSRRWPGSRTT